MEEEMEKEDGFFTRKIIDNPVAVLIIAVLSIVMGIFFIATQGSNEPIPRSEALSYSGRFDYYDTAWRNYRDIYFEDGSYYSVSPHTESAEFREKMENLPKGTMLYLAVNPNNDYVVEVKTDEEELLNFEASQQALDEYDNGYIVLGFIFCITGAFLIYYVIYSKVYKRKEEARQAAKGTWTAPLRESDTPVKARILLETEKAGYKICYRRVKAVNELVINGRVYDEKKGILEFAHRLCATVDGHSFEAGLDKDDCSYIIMDGTLLKSKKRWI